MIKHSLYLILALAFVMIGFDALAGGMGMGMGMGPPSPPCGTPPFPPCVVPIDGGIGILAGAGAVYSYFKLSKRNKKNPA